MAIFGIDTILPLDFTEFANDIIGMYWYAPLSGEVTEIVFYGNANATPGSGDFQGLLYQRTAADSGTLIGQTNTITLNTAPQWTVLAFNTPVSVTAGQTYWLSWWSDQDYDIKYDGIGNDNNTCVITGSTFGSPPASFTGANLLGLYPVMDSVYVVFTPDAEPDNPRLINISSISNISSLANI